MFPIDVSNLHISHKSTGQSPNFPIGAFEHAGPRGFNDPSHSLHPFDNGTIQIMKMNDSEYIFVTPGG